MAKCVSCWYWVGGVRGENCPMAKWVSIGFSAGCNLHKPRESIECPVEPRKAGGRSLPVQREIVARKRRPARPTVTPEGSTGMKEPNTTEAEYGKLFMADRKAVYEGFTFKMLNGHKYTPDWVVFDDNGGVLEAHEVKGGYAMFSQGRARLAFDQCKVEFPHVKFYWAKKLDKKKRKKDGNVWIVK